MVSSVVYESASHLLDIGCSVIPVSGKSPASGCRWGKYIKSLPSQRQLGKWFGDDRGFGIGVILGDVSQSLCVRDFDEQSSYDSWRASNPSLAMELPTVITARGAHVYYRSESCKPKCSLGDGEIRGNGNYVVAPPSAHPSGIIYSWMNPLDRLPRFLDPVESGFATAEQMAPRERRRNPRESGPQREAIKELLTQLPMACVASCFSDETKALVAAAIRATIPRQFGEREGMIWEFARRIMAVQELRNLNIEEVLPCVYDWYLAALPNIATKDWASTRSSFQRAWSRIDHPLSDGTITSCLQKADASPASSVAMRFAGDSVAVRLVGLCEQLQIIHGDNPFFLSTSACGLFGFKEDDRKGLHRKIVKLVNAGVLGVVSIGNSIQRKASEYRFLPPIEVQ